jgi:hypothetical protein
MDMETENGLKDKEECFWFSKGRLGSNVEVP